MRILLADDQMQVRSALRLLLEQEQRVCVVGEAAEATGLLLSVAEMEPDLVLLDWELPGLPIIQLLRLLWYEKPPLKIIAMSSQPQAEQQALNVGVERFICKSAPADQVLSIIRDSL
jgi:DNA-binding NarL/FixJ family response regulator